MMMKSYMDIIRVPWLTDLMQFITDFGSPAYFTIISLFIFAYLVDKKKLIEGGFLYLCLFSAWGIMDYLKQWFGRSRPTGESLTIASGYSFPSGHAMISMAFYGFLAALLLSRAKSKWSRTGAALLFILIFLIGFSRVYLNVHYTSDVIFGWLFGAICLTLCLKGLHRVQRR